MTKYIKRGAVATLAESDNSKRSAAATGDSLLNTYSGRPVLRSGAYKGYRQLIVKDNQNKNDDIDILRVARYLCHEMGFITTDHYYFENGKQERRHVHMLVRAPRIYNLIKTTEIFKLKQRLSYDIVREVQYTPTFSKPHIETNYIDLSAFTFEVELFSSNEHIFYCIEEYWMKEQYYLHRGCHETSFIDDELPFRVRYLMALSQI